MLTRLIGVSLRFDEFDIIMCVWDVCFFNVIIRFLCWILNYSEYPAQKKIWCWKNQIHKWIKNQIHKWIIIWISWHSYYEVSGVLNFVGYILYFCGWSPFEGYEFKGEVSETILNGEIAYSNGLFKSQSPIGMQVEFDR